LAQGRSVMSIHTESRRAAFGARFRGSVDVPGASPRPFAGLFDAP